ncbi:MAG TPA: hypothetical protein VNS09_08190 [Solirubrobacter sp.]|nr:hypothetical protein [Solirubrobacter sp.]
MSGRLYRLSKGAAAGVVLVVAVGGCVSIKSQSASQRLPGVVTLNVQVCVSDRNQDTYTGCVPGVNTAENDNGTDGDRIGSTPVVGNGQLLLGFRVPDGTVAPASFRSDDTRALAFNLSPGYTSALTAEYQPISGLHWVGYLSDSTSFNAQVTDNQLTTVRPEFGLPPGAAPYAGPFLWRVVAGSRQNLSTAPASAPIDCPVGDDDCFDSPKLSTLSGAAVLTTSLTTTVSDYAVLAPGAATAGHGETATLTFPLASSDPANKGNLPVTLSAATSVPGAQPALSAGAVTIPRNGQASATVSVAVPPSTALGDYTVTLTATAGTGVTRTRAAKLTVVDRVPPQVSIGTPADGATFVQAQRASAAYSCSDEFNGSGVASCAGPVPVGAAIDTSSPGRHAFTVTATDAAGNTASQTSTYTVTSPPVSFNLTFGFSASTRKATKFTALQAKLVPAGSTLTATCRGKGCPTKKVKRKRKAVTFTKHNASGTVTLTPWAKKSLRVGTVLRVVVTKPGAVGMVKTLTVRARKAPKVATACLQAGSTSKRVACT